MAKNTFGKRMRHRSEYSLHIWFRTQLFSRKPQGMRSLGRPKHRWEKNIEIGFIEVGYKGVK